MTSTPNTNVRDAAKAAIDSLPENSTWEDVFYRLHVRKKIEQGLADAENGELLSTDDVKRMLEERK